MKWHFGLFVLVIVLGTVVGAAQTSASPADTQSSASSAAKVRVPNVVGFRMDRATRTLRNSRLRVNEECSGLFGCIVKSRWWVCVQSPRAGRYVRPYSVVVIYAERRGEC
jgi:beta-lactam-binding protein with PASTA domain